MMRDWPSAAPWGARFALPLLLLALLPNEAALAHGGSFTPPPPPTPGGAAPRGTPRANTPTQVDPGLGGPVVTPGGGFLKVGPVGRRPPREFTPTFELSWQLWWRLNQGAFLPRRPATLRAREITPAPAPEEDPARRWEDERRRLARDVAAPLLRSLLDPATRDDDDVRASAAIALGKLTEDARDIDLLLGWLENADAKDLVREGAAVGLGLLRRSRSDLAFEANPLDPLRARLLMLFDQHVDGRRVDLPERTRQMAMFSIGLLGDQAWSPDVRSRDGRLLSSLLWQRLEVDPYSDRDLRIALLTALRLQPLAGLADGVRTDLEAAVDGDGEVGRKWREIVRGHALAAVAGLEGRGAMGVLLRHLDVRGDRPPPPGVRLAAAIAIGDLVDDLAATDRFLALRVLEPALSEDQELLLKGLTLVAAGRLIGADLAAGSDRLLESTKADDLLAAHAREGAWYLRGYGVLGLALAARGAPPSADAGSAAGRFSRDARSLLRGILGTRALEPELRGAAAVGLGLLQDEGALGDLLSVLRSPEADPDLRGHAALAVGQIGLRTPEAQSALGRATVEEGPEAVRASAARGLSLLGGSDTASRLVAALSASRRTSHLAGLTLALAHLGDLTAVEPLAALAGRGDVPDVVRAMAAVALGSLLDPEPTPSLLRLVRGSPYPLRSPALEELFTIL